MELLFRFVKDDLNGCPFSSSLLIWGNSLGYSNYDYSECSLSLYSDYISLKINRPWSFLEKLNLKFYFKNVSLGLSKLKAVWETIPPFSPISGLWSV